MQCTARCSVLFTVSIDTLIHTYSISTSTFNVPVFTSLVLISPEERYSSRLLLEVCRHYIKNCGHVTSVTRTTTRSLNSSRPVNNIQSTSVGEFYLGNNNSAVPPVSHRFSSAKNRTHATTTTVSRSELLWPYISYVQ